MPRLIVLWLLIVALPIYGGAGSLLQMLGPVHRHELSLATPQPAAAQAKPASVAAGFGLTWVVNGWQAWKDIAHKHAHSGLLIAAHQHADFERHHHAAVDAGVVVLGADEGVPTTASELGAAAAIGSATLPMGMSMTWRLPPALAAQPCWSAAAASRWTSADPRRRDRPPQG